MSTAENPAKVAEACATLCAQKAEWYENEAEQVATILTATSGLVVGDGTLEACRIAEEANQAVLRATFAHYLEQGVRFREAEGAIRRATA